MTSDILSHEASLLPLGPTTWESLRSQLADAECVWMDIHGVHHGRLPESQPLGTHLWAWRGNQAWRLRLDPDLIVGARLSLSRSNDAFEDPVSVSIQRLTPRVSPDLQLASLLAGIADRVDLAITQDSAPMTFLVVAA